MYYLMLRGMGGGEGAVDCVDGKQGIGKRTSSLDFYHFSCLLFASNSVCARVFGSERVNSCGR